MNAKQATWTYSSVELSNPGVLTFIERIAYEKASGTLFVIVQAPPYHAYAVLTGRRTAFDGMVHDDIFRETILRNVGEKTFREFLAALNEKAEEQGIVFAENPRVHDNSGVTEIFFTMRDGENGAVPETTSDNDRTPINP